MEGRCFKHGFEMAESRCRSCGLEYCSECLVYSFGPGKPPFCVPCALAAAGVRSNSGFKPAVSTREVRKMEKERRKAEKAARKRGEVPVAEPEPDAAPVAAVSWEPEPEPVAADDDNPFAWADAQDDRVPF